MKQTILFLLTAILLTGCASPKLTFMSFNIRNSSAWKTDGENNWNNRREAVAKMILEQHPDAIGMQEMLPDQVAFLDSALAGTYRRIGVGRDDGKNKGENMCIYYNTQRLRLVGYRTYWLSDTPDSVSFGWDAACRRTVTLGMFEERSTGRRFTYLNTHLDHVGQVARRNSVLQLCDLANKCDGPVIIGGDMNSDLSDPIFSPLKEQQLSSARDIAPVSDSLLTYNAYGKGKPSRIDHFFVRDFSVMEFHTLNGDFGVPYISDHYPVTTTLQFKKK